MPPTIGDRSGWTGRESGSETGLQYNRARYDDPKVGRWTSQHPLGFAAGDANIYRYGGNDATGATDPSGLQITPNHYIPVPHGRPPSAEHMHDFNRRDNAAVINGLANALRNLVPNNQPPVEPYPLPANKKDRNYEATRDAYQAIGSLGLADAIGGMARAPGLIGKLDQALLGLDVAGNGVQLGTNVRCLARDGSNATNVAGLIGSLGSLGLNGLALAQASLQEDW